MLRYLGRHWRGELSLPVSYWLNTFLGSIVVGGIIMVLMLGARGSLNPLLILTVIVVFYGFALVVAVWQFVGTWRSARNRKKTGRYFWAVVAQIMLVIGAASTAHSTYKVGLQVTELARVVFGWDDYAEFTIEMRGDHDLYIDGFIAFGMIDRLEPYVEHEFAAVHLNSPGGRIGPALHLAKRFADRNVTTATEFGCYSACTTMFIAGNPRILTLGAELGFHAGAMSGLSAEEIAGAQRAEMDFLSARGIEADFIKKAFATPNEDLWIPTYDELMRARVVTHVDLGDDTLVPIQLYCEISPCRERSTAPAWLQQIAALRNLDLPEAVQDGQTLERVIAGPENRLTYSNAFNGYPPSDAAAFDAAITAGACDNVAIVDNLLAFGVTVTWRYRFITGVTREVTVTEADCPR